MALRSAAWLALVLVGCGRGTHLTVPDATAVVIAPPPPPVAAPRPDEAPAPTPAAKPAEPEGPSDLRVELEIERGRTCTFVFRAGGSREERTDSWLITGIYGIRTEASPGCAAGTLYDFAAELAADPEQKSYHDTLNGGVLSKTARGADPSDGPPGIVAVDMNFDGYLDLSVQYAMGAYNESRRYWVFDPKTRTFVGNEALGELLWPTFDATAKVVKAGGRVGGPTYADGIYGWIGGQLVTLESSLSTLGEKPNGDPLPPGFSRWDTTYKRRNGKLVKIFDGPVKD